MQKSADAEQQGSSDSSALKVDDSFQWFYAIVLVVHFALSANYLISFLFMFFEPGGGEHFLTLKQATS